MRQLVLPHLAQTESRMMHSSKRLTGSLDPSSPHSPDPPTPHSFVLTSSPSQHTYDRFVSLLHEPSRVPATTKESFFNISNNFVQTSSHWQMVPVASKTD